MINFNKNLLINKKAFILGGSGLIGNEVTKLLLSCGCTVVNLDLKENSNFESLKFNKKKLKFFKFDCKNEKVIKNYKKVVKKYGIPDIFVNCSYPKTKDWKNNSFKKIKFLSLKKNIDTNLVNSSFLIREVAEMN